MYTPGQRSSLRYEIRLLRIQNASYKRFRLAQKQRADRLEKVVTEKDQTITRLEEELRKLKQEKRDLETTLDKTRQERDTYRDLVFKKRTASPPTGKHRGGQPGHPGHGRKAPEEVDVVVRVFLTHCPHCNTKLSRTAATDPHTVTDVPSWHAMVPQTTQYDIERQWCARCHKEVRGAPRGIVARFRIGINLLTMILLWRYRFRDPVDKISERIRTHYGMRLTGGGIIGMLHAMRTWLGPLSRQFLEDIRGSPVLHADETGWRVRGENWWSWVFSTNTATFYTIEETRGGGIPRQYLKGARGMLVRDDYPAYLKLALRQQSCWAHLLRLVRDAAVKDGASDEVHDLKTRLFALFALLAEDINRPFDINERKELQRWYMKDIQKIIRLPYQAADATRIQARIKRQENHLLTALVVEGGALTNNQAERDIRKLVVTRKISGGSQSEEGAKTHAVNLSVVETVAKRNQPLLDTLQDYLLRGAIGKN